MSDWVLITGASSGIGLELARLFAADKFNLVLLGRDETRLGSLARELHNEFGADTKILRMDLSQPNAAQDVFDALRDVPIDILVNNAGFGMHGPVAEADFGDMTRLLQVNMTALTQLTRLFLEPMLSRNRGRILNVASMAAFLPGPGVNVYYASKSFVYSFSYALSCELSETGVSVTCLCPGTTRTDFFNRAGMPLRHGTPMASARSVALAGYRGLMRGRRVVIPGMGNRVLAILARHVPDRLLAWIARRLHH